MAGPGFSCNVVEADLQHLGCAERLGDEQRPVYELVRGADQLDVDEVPGQMGEGERRFEPGNAATGDHDVHRAGGAPRPCR